MFNISFSSPSICRQNNVGFFHSPSVQEHTQSCSWKELQHIISSATTITGTTDLPLNIFSPSAVPSVPRREFSAHFHPITESFLAALLWKILQICDKWNHPLQEPFVPAVMWTCHNNVTTLVCVCSKRPILNVLCFIITHAYSINKYFCDS